MAVGQVGRILPRAPGPGGFQPWSAGMNLSALYANMSGVERMQAMLGQAFRDYLQAQPLNMALMGRAGVAAPQARAMVGSNLQSAAPSMMANPLADTLAENRLQGDMWGSMMDKYQKQMQEATAGGGMNLGPLLQLAGIALGGVTGGTSAAMVGGSAGGLLGQILGGRY